MEKVKLTWEKLFLTLRICEDAQLVSLPLLPLAALLHHTAQSSSSHVNMFFFLSPLLIPAIVLETSFVLGTRRYEHPLRLYCASNPIQVLHEPLIDEDPVFITTCTERELRKRKKRKFSLWVRQCTSTGFICQVASRDTQCLYV